MTTMPPPAATIRVDDAGFVVAIDQAFQDAFGWTPSTLVGRPLTFLVPPTLRDAHNLGFARFLATGEPRVLGRNLALEIVTADGALAAVDVLITADRADGRWGFTAVLRRG